MTAGWGPPPPPTPPGPPPWPPAGAPGPWGTPWPPPVRRRSRRAWWIALAVVLVVLLVAAVVVAVNAVASDPFARAALSAELRMRSVPEIEQRLVGLPSDEAAAEISGLSTRGLRRLDDGRLLERARVLGNMAAAGDETICAEIAFGEPTLDDLHAASRTLDDASIERLFEVGVDAAIAEARGSPPVQSVTEPQATAALEALEDRLPAAEAARWGRVIDSPDPGRLPDADQCWFLRTLLDAIPGMPEPHRHVLLRLTVETDTRPAPPSI